MSTENALISTDAELLMQFTQHRDEAAFRTLVERHGSLVMGICRQILRHEHDVDDACQATFVLLSMRAKSIRRTGSVASWLYRVAYRTAMRAAKQRQRRKTDSLREDTAVSNDPLVRIYEQSLHKALHEELSALPESYRAPLVLCYLQKQTRQEAATQLESTESSVKARLARGKRMLRLRLARRGIGLSVALGLVIRDVAEAAEPVGVDFVDRTVSLCAKSGSTGHLPKGDSSREIISLAKQGLQTMIIPTIAKSTAAVFVVGAAILTFTLNADDGAGGTSILGDSGANTPTIINSADFASQSDNGLPSLAATVQMSGPAFHPNYSNAASTAAPDRSDWVSDKAFELDIKRLEIKKDHILAKVQAYERLAKAWSRKKGANDFEALEAQAQYMLHRAEAQRLAEEAKLVDTEIEIASDRRKHSSATAGLHSTQMSQSSTRTVAPLRSGNFLNVTVENALPDSPIDGVFIIEPETGAVALGPSYGRVKVEGLGIVEAENAIRNHLKTILSNPRVQATYPSQPVDANPYRTATSIELPRTVPSLADPLSNLENRRFTTRRDLLIVQQVLPLIIQYYELAEKYGPHHPEVRSLAKSIDGYEKMFPSNSNTSSLIKNAMENLQNSSASGQEIVAGDVSNAELSPIADASSSLKDVPIADVVSSASETTEEWREVNESASESSHASPTTSTKAAPVIGYPEIRYPEAEESLPCCREGNLAYDAAVQASSEESDRGNLVAHATDGDLATRWCAKDDAAGEWIQLDLGQRKHIRNLRIHWERLMEYRYTVDVSADGKNWRRIVDDDADKQVGEPRKRSPEHTVDSPDTRYLQIELVDGDGFWASIREIEVSADELPDPPRDEWSKLSSMSSFIPANDEILDLPVRSR